MKDRLRLKRSELNSKQKLASWSLVCILILQSSAFSLPAYAARIHPSAGSTSAAFLKLGAGARPAAMAGAFTGVPGDPYAVYWNPAGLAQLDGEKNMGLFHNEYFQDLGQEFLYYTAPASSLELPLAGRPRAGVFGLGLNYFYTPKDMERRSGLNESDPENPISPAEGKFGAYDLAFSAVYGWEPRRDLALGAAFKIIRQSIDDRSGASAAVDLGVMRGFDWRGGSYTAGFSVQNLGPGIKFTEKRYGLPLIFRAGLSRRLPACGALISLEADKPVDNYMSLSLGGEYPLINRFALRAGYRYRQYGNELGPWSGFSAGAGAAFERLSFDYAFTPFGELGNSHRFSINFRFGETVRAAKPPSAIMPRGLDGAKNIIFKITARAQSISQRGVRYEIKAAAPDEALYGITFRTFMRGAAPADFSVAEGGLPDELLSGLPSGAVLMKAWQPSFPPGKVQGEIMFEFRAAKANSGAGLPGFIFRDADGWSEAPVLPAGEDRDFMLYSARAPLSTHYAVVMK
ncbi:MAG: PorV/PorQ family protein [Elusimicrobiales bacterium]|jgi:hypothetical protein